MTGQVPNFNASAGEDPEYRLAVDRAERFAEAANGRAPSRVLLTELKRVRAALAEHAEAAHYWREQAMQAQVEIERLEAELTEARDGYDDPLPDGEIDAIGDHGEDARVPVWDLESGVQLEGADSVAAWIEGVSADGDLSEGPAVDAIERDARKLLAAVAAHRRMADRSARPAGPPPRDP